MGSSSFGHRPTWTWTSQDVFSGMLGVHKQRKWHHAARHLPPRDTRASRDQWHQHQISLKHTPRLLCSQGQIISFYCLQTCRKLAKSISRVLHVLNSTCSPPFAHADRKGRCKPILVAALQANQLSWHSMAEHMVGETHAIKLCKLGPLTYSRWHRSEGGRSQAGGSGRARAIAQRSELIAAP